MMRLTIIGFGNQAKSWALNLKDSGFPVRVALRSNSASIQSVIEQGLEVIEIGSRNFYSDSVYALLTPDSHHHEFLAENAQQLPLGTSILYAHGFSVQKYKLEKLYPHLNHVLFAPKSIGSELRKQYELGGNLGAVYSLEYFHGPSFEMENWLKNMAVALGISMGPYKTTFKNETQADLYSEQGLLCSLIPYTAGKMFEHLIENGVEAELAYFECWHELKLIVNAMVDKGPLAFFDLISPNALIGAEKGYNRLFKPEFNNNLQSLMNEIEDGTFSSELDAANVMETRRKIREYWMNSPLQKTFEKINQDLK